MAANQGNGEAGTRSATAANGGRRYSLRTLLFLLVLATALPLIGIWAYTTWRAVQLEIERANQAVVSMADAMSSNTAATLDELRRLLAFLAERDQVRSLDPQRCDAMLADLPRLRHDLANVATVDLTGQGICSLLKPPDGVLRSVGETAWLKELKRSGDLVIGAPQRGIFSGKWVALLAYPLRDANGALRGAVTLSVLLTAFQPVAETTVEPGGMLAIYDSSGVVIARAPDGERLIGTNLSTSPLVRMVLEQRSGADKTSGQAGIERFHAFKPIGNSGWFAVAGLPTASIYAQARQNAWRAAALSGAVLMLAGFLVMVIQRRIAAPMLALTDTARKIEAGDLTARAPESDGPAEVAEVAIGLNRMLDRIPLMERALRDSESRYRKLVEEAPEAIVVHRNGRLLLANAAADRLYGMAEGEHMAGRHGYEFIDPDTRAASAARSSAVLASGVPSPSMELRHRRADGALLDVETVAVRIEYEGAPAVMVLIRDISARKAAERRVTRLTSLYAALSKTNETIFRQTDLLQICQTVCGIAVEDGGLAAAIVRVQDPESHELAVYAHAGAPIGWVRDFRIPLDHPFNNAARVAREGGPVVVNDFAADDNTRESRGELMRAGLHAAAMFALPVTGGPTGVLSVFARETDFFDPELVALLEEIARNLAFAFARQRDALAYAASEERYRMLFDAAPDAIRVICEDRVVMVNPAAVRLFGYADAGEMIGRPVYDNIDTTHQELARERLRIATGERLVLPLREHLIKRADDSTLLTEARLIPVDFNGKPAALAILRDLTARKAAEQRVQRLTRLYVALSRTNEAIFRNGEPDALYAAVSEIAVRHGGLKSAVVRMIAPETRMLEPNAYCGPDADWIGCRSVPLDDSGSNAAWVAREGGSYVCNDTWTDPRASAARADAVRVGVRSAATFALSVDGAIAGVFSVCAAEANFFDAEMTGLLEEIVGNLSFALSKMKNAAVLVTTEGRYRALFDASPDAIRVLCDGKVVMLNPAAIRLFGLSSAAEMIGKSAYDHLAPEFHKIVRERLRKVNELRQPAPPLEQVMVRSDGTRVAVEVTSMPFDFEGKPAALVIMHDLTARNEIERATQRLNAELEERVQQRTAELRRANAELESFSYSVAHDLRAPLRSMTGFAQLLALDVESGATEDLTAHVRRVSENAEKMNRLIDGLLNVSNSAHRKLAMQRVDMRAVAEEVLLESSARERARVVIGPMPTIDGDQAALRQVWTNLVSNALKYSAKQAQPAIELGCEPGDGMAVFRVQDNGVGFNAAYSEKLFGVFSRLHAANEFEGIGIGLAIVKRVVERHGGRVWAESSPNAGATFYFSLPLPGEQTPAAVSRAA
jgi:PAS domain S-box-containing protein